MSRVIPKTKVSWGFSDDHSGTIQNLNEFTSSYVRVKNATRYVISTCYICSSTVSFIFLCATLYMFITSSSIVSFYIYIIIISEYLYCGVPYVRDSVYEWDMYCGCVFGGDDINKVWLRQIWSAEAEMLWLVGAESVSNVWWCIVKWSKRIVRYSNREKRKEEKGKETRERESERVGIWWLCIGVVRACVW